MINRCPILWEFGLVFVRVVGEGMVAEEAVEEVPSMVEVERELRRVTRSDARVLPLELRVMLEHDQCLLLVLRL